jgi:hypothetical protein
MKLNPKNLVPEVVDVGSVVVAEVVMVVDGTGEATGVVVATDIDLEKLIPFP